MHPNKGSKRKPQAAGDKQASVNSPEPTPALSSGVMLLGRLLLVVALGISIYLAYSSFTSGGVAGCGVNSGCHAVLSSKWAYVAGLPVSVPAAILYVLVLLASFQIRPGTAGLPAFIVTAGGIAIIAAALWFSAIQLFILKSFCPYCMTAHVAGAVASVFLLQAGKKLGWFKQQPVKVATAMGLGAVVALSLMQAASAERQTFGQTQYASTGSTNSTVVTNASPVLATGSNSVATAQASINATAPVKGQTNQPIAALGNATPLKPEHYLLPIIQGAFTLDLRKLPVEGPLNAPHKMVKLFDFTCFHCRDLHHLLDQARSTFSNELAIVMLPVPLDANCNGIMRQTPASHVNACEYAAIGLAVARVAPGAFVQFSKWIFEPARPPSIQETRDFAAKLVGKENLEQELATQASYEQIQADVQIYQTNSAKGKSGKLPQLIFPNGASYGSITKLEAVYGLLNQHYGLSTNKN